MNKILFLLICIFTSTVAFAEEVITQERSTLSPFFGGGIAYTNSGIEYHPNFNASRTSTDTTQTIDFFGEVGLKFNFNNSYIAPRMRISSGGGNLYVQGFAGKNLVFNPSAKFDFDVMFGNYYKNLGLYVFIGGSQLKYSAIFNSSMRVTQMLVGAGMEYYLIKNFALFGEGFISFANYDMMSIRVNNVKFSKQQMKDLDPLFGSIKLKAGFRYYPAG